MYQTSDIRKNLKIEIDGVPFIVVDFQFVKPGKGNAFTRTRLKNMINGNVLDRTYKSGEKLIPAKIEERNMQYLYNDGSTYHFMDTDNYEQVGIDSEQVGDSALYLDRKHGCQHPLLQRRAHRDQPALHCRSRDHRNGAGHQGRYRVGRHETGDDEHRRHHPGPPLHPAGRTDRR